MWKYLLLWGNFSWPTCAWHTCATFNCKLGQHTIMYSTLSHNVTNANAPHVHFIKSSTSWPSMGVFSKFISCIETCFWSYRERRYGNTHLCTTNAILNVDSRQVLLSSSLLHKHCYPSALRAGGVLSSRFGRAGGRPGGRLPNLRNPYLCNRLTDFLHSKFYGIV